MNSKMIKSKLNPSLEVVAFSGHFATRHSHNTHYIDITRMKHEFTMAREAAIPSRSAMPMKKESIQSSASTEAR